MYCHNAVSEITSRVIGIRRYASHFFYIHRRQPELCVSSARFRYRSRGVFRCHSRMLNSVLRLARTRTCTRPISTLPHIGIRSTKYVQALHKETGLSLWRLLDTLHSRKPHLEALSTALHKHGLSLDQFNRWKPVLLEPDIDAAVANLRTQRLQVTPQHASESAPPQPPPWLVLYLASYKVRTPTHAAGPLLDLVYAHIDTAPTTAQGPLLIFAMLNLARFNLIVPIRRVVDTFLTTPLTSPDLHFNLFLQAMSANPMRSVESANAAVLVLRAMESRQLELRSETYEALLKDRFITLQLTKYLRERMVQEGFVPTASHLEAYLRIFAKNGAIHDAKEYYHAIHARSANPDSGDPPEASTAQVYRANTLFLSAQEDRTSAFSYLRSLKKLGKNTRATAVRHPGDKPPRVVHKQKFDVYDWTATLAVAARDRSTSAEHLIRTFESSQAKHSIIRPTVVTYTILIRGLLSRHKFAKAEKYWQSLLKTGLKIDKEALTVGLQALTRAGKPHKALALLEKYAGRDNELVPGTYQIQKPITLTAISMNEFLVALNRISRPDVVFRLWDYMTDLYRVLPDASTLSILLQSTRLASKMDDSFSGAVAQLALKNPFRRPRPAPSSRADMLSALTELVGPPAAPTPRPYASGIWHDQPAPEHARLVFHRVVLGAAGDKHALAGLAPPAHAIRASFDADPVADPMASFGLALAALSPLQSAVALSAAAHLTPAGASYYPSIVPTPGNFYEYVVNLGVAAPSRAAEIPLALAWMRGLGVVPERRTVAVALVLWAEVSVRAPLIESWVEGEGKGEYGRLVEWLKGWVGEGGMPREAELGRWGLVVQKMRERAV